MKNIKILTIIMVVFLSSCSDFLEEEQVTVLNNSYFETEEGCEALINSCYESLRIKSADEWCYGIFVLGTDEFMKTGECVSAPYGWWEYNDYNTDLDGHTDDGAPMDIGDWWNLVYKGIDRCNLAIDLISSVDDGEGVLKDQKGKDQRTAEVRFIRAYHYFDLVQQFGAIPLKLTPTIKVEFEFPRSSASDVYDAIIDDLSWAYDHIEETQAEFGRITKDAVRHYWAKVLLTRHSAEYNPATDADEARNYDLGGDHDADLAKAASLIEEIETGKRHSLVPDYADLWDEDNQENEEIILSVQFNDIVGLNGDLRLHNGFRNTLHRYWFLRYDNGEPGMKRCLEYGLPFRRVMLTDYAIDVHDRLNDSRLRKSVLEVFHASDWAGEAGYPKWTKAELLFAFDNVAPDGSWAIRYGDTIKAGDIKFEMATGTTGDDITVGDTALVFLINDENTTLTDREMVAAGYKIYARYYWATDTFGNPVSLETYDRNDWASVSTEKNVVTSSAVSTFNWGRDKAPGINKFRDRKKPGGYSEYQGTRDFFIARLAESYLIAAEAYGRLENYTKAAEFINKVRWRAGYDEGEEKPIFWWKYDGGTPAEKTASTKANMMIDENYWNDDSHDDVEMYPPTVSTKQERFIHFMLNERSREMLGELNRWTDLKRTGTLVERNYQFNIDVANEEFLDEHHRVRPIPVRHLDAIKENGSFLTPAQKIKYQNKGYL